MKVYFIKELPGVAKKGEIKDVKPGYFFNFLKPNNYAVLFDENLEKKIKKEQKDQEKEKEKVKEICNILNNKSFEFLLKVQKDKVIFGSISKKDIISKIKEFLKEKNLIYDDFDVDINKIKNTGEHKVKVIFPYGIEAEINVIVKPKED
jgi:large subunit ribosomal protein L9